VLQERANFFNAARIILNNRLTMNKLIEKWVLNFPPVSSQRGRQAVAGVGWLPGQIRGLTGIEIA